MREECDMSNGADDFSLLLGPEVPTRRYAAGEMIFREGDPGLEFYVIKSGKVRVLKGNRMLETIGENAIFGEMALIDASPRRSTVIAETDATTLPINMKQIS